MWILYAVGSSFFAGITAVLAKCGIKKTDSDVATMVRTVITGKANQIKKTDRRELRFIILSGFATGASWLCYYKALQDGPASVVVPIDKLSILVTIFFSWLVFHEKLSKKSVCGLTGIVLGTLMMAVL